MITFRLARQTDAAACAVIEQTQPRAAGWGASGFASEITQTCAVIWCAFDGGKAVGFVSARAVQDSAEIVNVAVVPDYTRRGIGKQLLAQVLSDLATRGVKRVTLEVAQDNVPAQKLYAQAGFVQAGVRKNFYGPGCDGLLLGKDL